MCFPAWNQMLCKSEIYWFNLYLYTKSFLCQFQLESHAEAVFVCLRVCVCAYTLWQKKPYGWCVCVLCVCTVSTESKSVLANTAVLHSTVIWHFEAFSAPQIVHIATARSLWMLQEWLIHLGNSAQIASYHLQEGKHNLRNKTRQ